MCDLKKRYRFITGSLLLICSSVVMAIDPVYCSLTSSSGFPVTVGNTYVARYTCTNNFIKPMPFQILRQLRGASFSVNDTCSEQAVAAHASCPVTITYKPTRTGTVSILLGVQRGSTTVWFKNEALSGSAQSGGTAEISGAVSQPLPADAIVTANYPVTFRFTNLSSSAITESAPVTITPVAGIFSTTSNTCTSAINPSNYCTVSGTFTPTTPNSTASVGATYSYGSGKSVSLNTNTYATTTGSCVSGSVPLELPAQTYSYGDNVVKFQFTNYCGNPVTLQNVSLSLLNSSGSAVKNEPKRSQVGNDDPILTTGNNNCSGSTLSSGSSCTVYASLVPGSTIGETAIEAKVGYTGAKTAIAITSSNVQANHTTERMITVVNQCSVPMWMTFNAAAYGNTPGCATGAYTCPSGTTCNASASSGAGLCYFSNPTQGVNQDGKLLAAVTNQPPSTMDIIIPESSGPSGANLIYNAGIMPRLGCTGTGTGISCKINNCTTEANGSGLCAPGNGPVTGLVAFNAVEFTFNRTSTDGVYNGQIIDGITVPMEMKGRGSTGTAPYDNCAAMGAIIQPTTGSASTQLGSCSFDFSNSPSPGDITYYRYVYPSNQANYCDSDANCTVSGEVCGLAYNSSTNLINKVCGALEGYTSINKGVCSQGSAKFGRSLSMTSGFGTYVYHTLFSCDTSYGSGAYTGTDIYACTNNLSGSCYTAPPPSPCCGCANWWLSGLTVPNSTYQCNSQNTDWLSVAKPAAQWIKTACPTSYSYQYDDKSSSFTCTVTNGSGNTVTNYQVTFCPGGKEISTIAP